MFRGFVFTADNVTEKNDPAEVIKDLKNSRARTWIDLEDPTEQEIDFLIQEFDFHPLSIEDAMIQKDHPKLEEFDDYSFAIFYAARIADGEIKEDQLNIFIGKNYIVTIHEEKIRAVQRVIARARSRAKNGFHQGVDLVFHALADNTIDEYFPIIEKIEDRLDEFEDVILEERKLEIIDEIITQKRNILFLRKLITAERGIFTRLLKGEMRYIRESTQVYFRDIFDHLSVMNATLENLRDLIPSLMDAYNSLMNKKTNDAIHGLTVAATIAIPLTVLTSYYGMNIYLPFADKGIWGWMFVNGILIFSGILTYLFLKKIK